MRGSYRNATARRRVGSATPTAAPKTAMIASDQATESQTSFPAGVPTKRARAASTIVVNGLCSATGCSHPGIDSTGTNADETNVSGKRTVNPNAFDASGDEAVSPMSANTHENA